MVNVSFADMKRIYSCYVKIVVAVACLAGCDKNEAEYVFPKFARIESRTPEILSADIMFSNINALYEYKDYLIVVAYDRTTNKYLHVYDKRTGGLIADGLYRGRGPRDIQMGALNTSFDAKSGVIKMWDMGKSARIHVDVDLFVQKHMDEAIMEYEDGFPRSWVRHRHEMNNGCFLNVYNPSHIQDLTEFNYMTVTDDAHDTLAVMKNFPDIPAVDRFHVYTNSLLSVSQDCSTIAICTSCGAMLDVFEIRGGKIENVYSGKFAPYSLTENKDGIDVKETVYGFQDVEVTADRIISAFHGKKSVDAELMFQNVAIWTLSGKAKKLINTGYSIENLTYDEDESMLYLVVSDHYGTYLAKMDNVI